MTLNNEEVIGMYTVIGSADGPTSVFIAGKLGNGTLAIIFAAAVIAAAVVILYLKRKKK